MGKTREVRRWGTYAVSLPGKQCRISKSRGVEHKRTENSPEPQKLSLSPQTLTPPKAAWLPALEDLRYKCFIEKASLLGFCGKMLLSISKLHLAS